MQLRASWSNPLGQGRFDIHMDIFERFVPLKFASRHLAFDFPEPALDLFDFVRVQNSGRSQRGGVSN